MKSRHSGPRICALVANAKGARLYTREKSKILLVSALLPEQGGFKARDVAQWLERELAKIQIDRFVLIAPAAFLSVLHKAIVPHIYHYIVAEIKKDLLGGSDIALQSELRKILWF